MRKKRSKKNKKLPKRIISGSLAAAMIFSLVPNIEYYITKYNVENEITFSDSSDLKEDSISDLFWQNLQKNNKLTAEEKKLIYNNFKEYFLDKYSKYLDENSIVSMCASARTIDMKEMSEFAKKWSWWSGSYNPYTNRVSVSSYDDKPLIAHEDLHANLKNGIISTGLNRAFFGYGLNEGGTSLHSDNASYGYFNERNYFTKIGLIIGYDKMMDIYTNGKINDLVDELSIYMPKIDAIKLVSLIDINVYNEYKSDFVNRIKRNIGIESEPEISDEYDVLDPEDYKKIEDEYTAFYYGKNYVKRLDEIQNLIFKLYQGKYGEKIEENPILYNIFTEERYDSNERFSYTIDVNEYGKVVINIEDKLLLNPAALICRKNTLELVYDFDEFRSLRVDNWVLDVTKKLDENISFYYEGKDVIKKFEENNNKKLENFDFMYNARYHYEDDTMALVAYTKTYDLDEKRYVEYKYTLEEFAKLDFDEWCKMANEDIKDVPIGTKIYK